MHWRLGSSVAFGGRIGNFNGRHSVEVTNHVYCEATARLLPLAFFDEVHEKRDEVRGDSESGDGSDGW